MKNWGSLSSIILAGHIIAMATRYIKRMTATCSPMNVNEHMYDIIVASIVKWWYCSFFKV